MTSEEAFQQKYPVAVSVMKANGIVAGQYSFSAFPETGGGYGYWVSPTAGNSALFTQEVQDDLAAEGIQFKNNLT